MQRQHVPHALTPGPQAGRDLKVWSVWKVTQALKSKAMVLGFRQRPRTLPSLGTARVWSGQDAKPEKADPQLTPQARHTATTLVFSLAQLKTESLEFPLCVMVCLHRACMAAVRSLISREGWNPNPYQC